MIYFFYMKLSFFYKVTSLLSVLVLFSLVFISSAQEGTNSSKSLFLDFDQDGLSNDEETAYGTDMYVADTDKDGYSDYTEVSGGYDPLKPAPGDRIVKEKPVTNTSAVLDKKSNNLTDEAATQLADMISNSVPNGETVTLLDVEQIVKDAVEKSTEVPELPEIDMDRIRIQDQSYKKLSKEDREEQIKKDAREYISAILYVFSVQFPQLDLGGKEDPTIAVEGTLSDITTSFASGNFTKIEELSESGERAVEQLFDIEVPETLSDMHVRGIQLAYYVQQMKNNIKIQPEDPLESITNISLAQGFIVAAQEFFSDVEVRMKEMGLDDSIIPSSN